MNERDGGKKISEHTENTKGKGGEASHTHTHTHTIGDTESQLPPCITRIHYKESSLYSIA